jgi:hypothetical protein
MVSRIQGRPGWASILLLAALAAVLPAASAEIIDSPPAPGSGAARSALPQETVRTPEDTIVAQLDAFNAGNVDAMVANLAEEFAWFAVDSDRTVVELAGRNEFRRSMESYFASVYEPRAEIHSLTASGNFVAVVETAFWLTQEGEAAQSSLAVYEVRDGLIHRVWYYPVSE